MYGEDVDLCQKIRRAGYKNVHEPRAAVIHVGGGSSGAAQTERAATLMRESTWRFLRKTRGGLYAFGYRTSTLIAAFVRIIALMICGATSNTKQDDEARKASLRRWFAVMVWSLRGIRC
jgi:GT2 family glycosyltransferase